MLYIATFTRRGRFADMSDDVFNYIRDRYFVGEDVEAIVKKHWYDCKVCMFCPVFVYLTATTCGMSSTP